MYANLTRGGASARYALYTHCASHREGRVQLTNPFEILAAQEAKEAAKQEQARELRVSLV